MRFAGQLGENLAGKSEAERGAGGMAAGEQPIVVTAAAAEAAAAFRKTERRDEEEIDGIHGDERGVGDFGGFEFPIRALEQGAVGEVNEGDFLALNAREAEVRRAFRLPERGDLRFIRQREKGADEPRGAPRRMRPDGAANLRGSQAALAGGERAERCDELEAELGFGHGQGV